MFCPRCKNTARFVREVVDLEYVDGEGRTVLVKRRVEVRPAVCVHDGQVAVTGTDSTEREVGAS